MTDERFKQVYQRYKHDPNFNDQVNRLFDLMADYRWSSGDHSDMYEQWWHEAVLMAEAIHGANVSDTRLDEVLGFAEEVKQ